MDAPHLEPNTTTFAHIPEDIYHHFVYIDTICGLMFTSRAFNRACAAALDSADIPADDTPVDAMRSPMVIWRGCMLDSVGTSELPCVIMILSAPHRQLSMQMCHGGGALVEWHKANGHSGFIKVDPAGPNGKSAARIYYYCKKTITMRRDDGETREVEVMKLVHAANACGSRWFASARSYMMCLLKCYRLARIRRDAATNARALATTGTADKTD